MPGKGIKHRFSEKQEILVEESLIVSHWTTVGLSKVAIIAQSDEPRSEAVEPKLILFSE